MHLGGCGIFFVRQKEQKGLGDAVRYASSFGDEELFNFALFMKLDYFLSLCHYLPQL